MDIVDDRLDRMITPQILIVSAAGLPELEDRPIAVLDSEFLDPILPTGFQQMLFRFDRDRALERGEDVRHFVIALRRPPEQVDMFRHDDVSPEFNPMPRAQTLKRIDYPFARTVSIQKFPAMRTGTRHKVDVMRFVVRPSAFSNGGHGKQSAEMCSKTRPWHTETR